jgi:hypothetical protein
MKPVIKLLLTISAFLLLSVGAIAQAIGDCGYWDGVPQGAGTVKDYQDRTNHTTPTGMHYMDVGRSGTCNYQCPPGQCVPNTQCIATIDVSDPPTSGDEGPVQPSGWKHVWAQKNEGTIASNSGAISAPASGADVVASCYEGNCTITVTLSAGGLLTDTVSGNGSELWTGKDTFIGYCPSQKAFPQTPIIIDIMDEGFQLTDADNGVVTDMVWPGHRMRYAWTKAESHNAFLYLDGHLFGNNTPQPPSKDPNGFRALAVYDTNHDGVIDALDPIYTELRLWIDANHDGTVQPEELFTLPGMGVYSISLDYTLGKYYDAQGNLFRFRGHLQKEARGVNRTIYDVLLTQGTHAKAAPTIKDSLR